MGCCASRPVDNGPEAAAQPTASLDTHHNTSSTRAIAQSAVPPSTTLRNTTRSLRPQPSLTTNSSTPRQSTAAPDLTEQPNAPLRQHPPWISKKRLWTPAQLVRERYEFFETRVTGNAEIWAALRTATELMRDGDTATAQEILTAAGVTLPTGDLVSGAFDLTGNLYRIPREIVRDPENVVKDSDEIHNPVNDPKATSVDLNAKEIGELDTDQEEDAVVIETRREEKGKGNERDLIKVKCRLSDRGGPDVVISISKSQNVGVLARRVAAQAGIMNTQRVRIAYLGKILKENETLDSQGWKAGHILNALVSLNPDAGSVDTGLRGSG